MLVLARKVGQSIYVELESKRVEIVVLHITGSQVRFGLKGCESVNIVRRELVDAEEEQAG